LYIQSICTQSSPEIQEVKCDEEKSNNLKPRTGILKRTKPFFNVDNLTQDEFLNHSKKTESKSIDNQVHIEEELVIEEINIRKFNTPHETHSELRKLKSFSSFLSETSNSDDKKLLEIVIESPVFSRGKKKSSIQKSYDVDKIFLDEDAPSDEQKSKLKTCVKSSKLDQIFENDDELTLEKESEKSRIRMDLSKKSILNLSLSTSSLSISDDNESPNHNENKKKTKKVVHFQEEIEIENPEMNEDLKKSNVYKFEESFREFGVFNDSKSDTKHPIKCGTEWLKRATETLNETTNGDCTRNEGESNKKTSPSSITLNTSNLYLQDNDLKRRKCKYVKNGMAEKLQKILLRQTSSLNFIKHQQTKDEKCLFIFFYSFNAKLPSRNGDIYFWSKKYNNSFVSEA